MENTYLTKLILLVFIVFIASFFRTSSGGCPDGWEQHKRQCYFFNISQVTSLGMEAEKDCQSKGEGIHLASIISYQDRIFAYTFSQNEWIFVGHNNTASNYKTWINYDGTDFLRGFNLYYYFITGLDRCVILRPPSGHLYDYYCDGSPRELSYMCKLYLDWSCLPPEPYVNAQQPADGSYMGNSSLTVFCKTGWQTVDNTTYFMIFCDLNEVIELVGLWTSDYTGCPNDINECETPSLCGNHSQCINTQGSFYCICLDGYQWKANSNIPEIGGNIATTGACEAYVPTCDTPPTLAASSSSYSSTIIGSDVVYTCDLGYRPSLSAQSASGYYQLECSDRFSHWMSRAGPECTRVFCGDPGSRAFATRSGSSFYYQDKVMYNCWPGFASGDGQAYDVITCQANGLWSQGSPCSDVDECKHLCSWGECINYPGSYICITQELTESDIYIILATVGLSLTFLLIIIVKLCIMRCCPGKKLKYDLDNKELPNIVEDISYGHTDKDPIL